MDSRVRPEFAERVLPIDDAIATRCAHLHIPDRRNEADALIARYRSGSRFNCSHA